MSLRVTSPRGVDVPTVAMNKNTNWLDNKASWLFYAILVIVSWLMISNFVDPGMAWTYVHIGHGLITYYLFHWLKGSPIHDGLTFWEQIDSGVQGTATRKFFMAVPLVLFLLASHSSEFERQPLGVNLVVVVVLLIAKMSSMHKVRIMGINKY